MLRSNNHANSSEEAAVLSAYKPIGRSLRTVPAMKKSGRCQTAQTTSSSKLATRDHQRDSPATSESDGVPPSAKLAAATRPTKTKEKPYARSARHQPTKTESLMRRISSSCARPSSAAAVQSLPISAVCRAADGHLQHRRRVGRGAHHGGNNQMHCNAMTVIVAKLANTSPTKPRPLRASTQISQPIRISGSAN